MAALILAENPMAPPMACAPATPSAMPIRPPIRVMTADSARNCRRMEPVRAPRDLRMPISRVRSVTDTSMMFITPMPPTSREMAATITTKMEMLPITELIWEI